MLIVGFAVYLIPVRSEQPFTDLLRNGWYSFNRFGYRSNQLMYSPPLVTNGYYEKYHDIVVIGDSFSNQLPYSWTNRIAAYGWSVLLLPVYDSLAPLLASAEFQRKPPSVVILAVVERSLQAQLISGKPCVKPLALPPSKAPTLPTPLPRTALTALVTPPVRALPNIDQITYARDFFINSAKTSLGLKPPNLQAYALKAARFSNARPRDILVLPKDLEKRLLSDAEIQAMRCRLLEYRAQIEENGKTRFVFMPIPDKLSAYHADLVGSSLPRSILPKLIQPEVESPRLDLALRRAIEEGQIDIYLPSDTHWGTNGYRVAADTLLDYLTKASKETRPSKVGRNGMPRAQNQQSSSLHN